MQLNASKLASRIIYSHMQNIPLKKEELVVEKGFKFGIYSLDGLEMLSTIEKSVDLSKKFSQIENNFILIDISASGHLGVGYIAIEETILFEALNTLKQNIVITFVLFYLVIILVGFYLTKLFIKPIVHQRIKLNNFIKDTTHELNTPISALIMSVNNKKALDEKGLNRVTYSAKRISDIYNDLTYLFLNNEKEIPKVVQKIDLKNILKEQIEYHSFFATKKQIKIEQDIHSLLFSIDKENFHRIVNNLISNAIKYTPSRGAIFIQLKDNSLIVKDTGIGIDKKSLSKIFDRFYRDTTIVGGFGIGLSIVDSICKEYNIKVNIDSEIGVGTTFTLIFEEDKTNKKRSR